MLMKCFVYDIEVFASLKRMGKKVDAPIKLDFSAINLVEELNLGNFDIPFKIPLRYFTDSIY